MQWKVPLADVSFGPEEHEAVRRVLESGWISNGPETERFESEFAQYMNIKHAVAVSSGTAALHIALLALGIGPGDEVVVPSLTFVATANAVLYTGAKPVFADITSQEDWNISPADIESKITEKTKAVIPVHYGGFPCRMDLIQAIAVKHEIKIVEDAAHAPGASFQGKKLGTWRDAGCFSLFANKNMTTGEGGLVVTRHDQTAQRLRRLRSHGMTALTWDRHRGHSFSYDVEETGFNYRIDEMRAALGRVQLASLDENNKKRRALTHAMRELLQGFDSVSIPFPDCDLDECSCHIFPVLLDSQETRPAFMASMKEAGIQTSIHYPPIHRFTAFEDSEEAIVPLTDEVTSREVTLPLFPGMTEEHLDRICQAVGQVSVEKKTLYG